MSFISCAFSYIRAQNPCGIWARDQVVRSNSTWASSMGRLNQQTIVPLFQTDPNVFFAITYWGRSCSSSNNRILSSIHLLLIYFNRFKCSEFKGVFNLLSWSFDSDDENVATNLSNVVSKLSDVIFSADEKFVDEILAKTSADKKDAPKPDALAPIKHSSSCLWELRRLDQEVDSSARNQIVLRSQVKECSEDC